MRRAVCTLNKHVEQEHRRCQEVKDQNRQRPAAWQRGDDKFNPGWAGGWSAGGSGKRPFTGELWKVKVEHGSRSRLGVAQTRAHNARMGQ